MKAEELRIGNLVWISDTVTLMLYREIEKINIHHLMGLTGWKEPIVEIEPIPLTKEWLIRFGFNYEDPLIYGKSGWYLKLKNQDLPSFIFFNNHLQCSLFISSSFNMCFIDINGHCEHVHQLQNLYFSLTGQELTIK
jgi:hypothetical protein